MCYVLYVLCVMCVESPCESMHVCEYCVCADRCVQVCKGMRCDEI